MSNQTDLVLVSVEKPGIGVITLNNPDRMNAWSAAMSAQFFARLEECRVNPEVRVVVVTGAGKGFCPGADMDALNQIRANPAGGAGPATGAGRFSDFISYPKPIIAAMNGAAAGVGFVLALFCDLRFAASGIKLTTSFSRRGLIAEYGSSWALPKLIGMPRALDLLLSRSNSGAIVVMAHVRSGNERIEVPENRECNSFELLRRISGDIFLMSTRDGKTSDFELVVLKRKGC